MTSAALHGAVKAPVCGNTSGTAHEVKPETTLDCAFETGFTPPVANVCDLPRDALATGAGAPAKSGAEIAVAAKLVCGFEIESANAPGVSVCPLAATGLGAGLSAMAEAKTEVGIWAEPTVDPVRESKVGAAFEAPVEITFGATFDCGFGSGYTALVR